MQELSKAGNSALVVQNGGSNPGTYATKLAVYKYAGWISPEFEVDVYNIFDKVVTGQYQPVAKPTFQLPQTYEDPLEDLAKQSRLRKQAEADKQLALEAKAVAEEQVFELEEEVASLEEDVSSLVGELAEAAPVVALHNATRESGKLFSLEEVAKLLAVGSGYLREWLKENEF